MNKIIGVFIGLAVGVIMVASLLMPVINDAVDATKVVYNNEEGQYSSIIGEDMTIEVIESYNLSVNGVPVELINGEIPAIVTDSFMVKIDTLNSGNYIAYYSETTGSVRTNNFVSLTITISDNNANIVVGNDEPVSIPISWGYIASTTGDYRAIWIPFEVKINNISQFCGANWIGTTGKFASYHGDKVLYDGNEITANYNLTPYNQAEGIYSLKQGETGNDYSFEIDNNGTPYTVTPFLCIVPAEITGTVSGGTASNGLLMAIPLLVIVALIVSAVSIIRFRD